MQSNQSGAAQEQSPVTRTSKHTVRKLFGLLLFIILITAAGYFILFKNFSTRGLPPPPGQTQIMTGPLRLCFIQGFNLSCGDEKMDKFTQYRLPTAEGKFITTLIPSPDKSKYIGIPYETTGMASVWLLDDKLTVIKRLKLPAGPAGDISWAQDGKSIFLAYWVQSTGELYSYNLDTETAKQLTTANEFNKNPYETKDGKIIYLSYGKEYTPYGQLYIMNADGSSPHPFDTIKTQVNNYSGILNFSYDMPTDTIFALIATTDQKFLLAYGKVNENKMQTIEVDPGRTNGDTITRLNNTTIILSRNERMEANIIDLSSGKVIKTIAKFNSPVGMISDFKINKLKLVPLAQQQ